MTTAVTVGSKHHYRHVIKTQPRGLLVGRGSPLVVTFLDFIFSCHEIIKVYSDRAFQLIMR